MPTPTSRPRKRRWPRRLLLALLILIGLLVLGWFWQDAAAERELREAIAALRAAGEPVELIEFRPEPVADEENAAEFYWRAASSLWRTPATTGEKESDPLDIGRLRSLCGHFPAHRTLRRRYAAELRQVLALTADARAIAREARPLDQADWKVDYDRPALSVLTPELGGQRELALALACHAAASCDAGDDAGATGDIRDLLAQSRCIGRSAGLVPNLYRASIDRIACECIEQVLPTLKSPRACADAGAITAVLLEESGLIAARVRAMQAERCMVYDTGLRLRRGEMSLHAVQGDLRRGPTFIEQINRTVLRPMMTRDIVWCMSYMADYVSAARADALAGALARCPALPQPDGILGAASGRLRYCLPPVLARAFEIDHKTVARRRLAATGLALRLYELDHGRRPAELDDLVPRYLPALPRDPLAADGRTFAIITDSKTTVLASVGLARDQHYISEPTTDAEDSEYVTGGAFHLPFYINGDRPEGELPPEYRQQQQSPGPGAGMPATGGPGTAPAPGPSPASHPSG